MHRIEDLDLNLLHDLVALVETRSVTEAGRRRHLTQSAMSRRLARLRETVGDVLLVPDPGGLVPSPRALALADAARQALVQIGDAFRSPPTFDPTQSTRRFQVATSDYGEFVVVPTILSAMRELGATVAVTLVRRPADPVESLRNGTLDLEIGPRGLMGSGLQSRTIAPDGFLVAARAGHALSGRTMDLATYLAAEHMQIAPGGNPGGPVDGLLARRQLSRTIKLQVAHFVAAPFLLAETDLLLTGPELLLRKAARYVDLQLWPLPLEVPPTEVQMYWHAHQQNDPGHRWLRQLVVEVSDAAFR